MATKKTLSQEYNAKFVSLRASLNKEIKVLMAAVKLELQNGLTTLNKLGSSVKIAAFLKEQKIKGTSDTGDCPVQRYLQKRIAANFGLENSVEVDGSNASIDCSMYVSALGDEVGTTVSVKLPKTVANFVNEFDKTDGAEAGSDKFAKIRA